MNDIVTDVTDVIEQHGVDDIWHKFKNMFWDVLPQIILALIILIVGWIAAKLLTKLLLKFLHKSSMEKSVTVFIGSLLSITLKIFVVIGALSTLGVNVSSMIAAIGAAGLAAGFAVKDTLSNMASGIIIVLSKPFIIGDYIDLGDGKVGQVEKIDIMFTTLRTIDYKSIIVPNSLVSANTVINNTRNGIRRLDLPIGISYHGNIDQTKAVIEEVIAGEELAIKKDECKVVVNEYKDSNVEIVAQVWCKSTDYLELKFRLREKIYEAFKANDIEIPFYQVDIHMD